MKNGLAFWNLFVVEIDCRIRDATATSTFASVRPDTFQDCSPKDKTIGV